MKILDSGFRRNDEKKAFGTFYETIFIISEYLSALYATYNVMQNASGSNRANLGINYLILSI